MSLLKYEKKPYLDGGWHTVTIDRLRWYECHTGNAGVAFVLKRKDGAEGEASMTFVEECYWVFARIARACGFDDAAMDAIDPANREHYSRLVGRKLRVFCEIPAGRKYHEVVDFAPDDGTDPPAREPKQSPTTAANPGADAGLAAAAEEVPF